ncbi:ras-like protein family member 10B [Caerostris darwini]|uniref:Ras-like protein family member 10B n=1 Tax=Caerostris darwini TaxID=1538125 RepID=A0AAV4W9N2_9ARAC|nr:ras-like protein family member 10B [Caerostris darwini]
MASGKSSLPCGMLIVETRPSTQRSQVVSLAINKSSTSSTVGSLSILALQSLQIVTISEIFLLTYLTLFNVLFRFSYEVDLVKGMQVIKVIILGAAGVGKSSLIRQFVYSEFSEEYFPTDSKTVHTPTVVFNEHVYSMRIVDLPVIPYFPSNSANEWADFRNYGLRSASAYILVFDLNDLETFQYVKSIRDQICDTIHNVTLFIVGNKQDLIRDRVVHREVRDVPALVKKHWKCSYVECSARHNYHVVSLFKELVKELACEKFGQKLPSYSSPRFESLHAHRERRGDSVVKCSIM